MHLRFPDRRFESHDIHQARIARTSEFREFGSCAEKFASAAHQTPFPDERRLKGERVERDAGFVAHSQIATNS
jgi:hypothetical protein